MSKASESDLGTLHGAVAVALTDVIQNGAVVGSTDGGEPIKVTAPASYFAAAIALLKNNNITADPEKNAALSGLRQQLATQRQSKKGRLSGATLDEARDRLERELGGSMTDD